MKKLTAEVLLIVIVAFWGLSFSLTKPLLSKMGVFNFLSYRFLIGGLMLVVILLMTKKLIFDKGLLKSGIFSGIILFLAFYCHIEGLKHTSIAKNAFIVGSSIVFVPILLLLLFKVRASSLTLIQTVIAIVGLALITLVNISAFNKGDVLTLIGTIFYALYTIMVEKSVRKYRTDVFTAVQLTSVGLLSLMATYTFETPTASFTRVEWANLIFMAIVLTGLFYYMLNTIQVVLSASNVTLVFTLEPFFATLFAWFFLREYIGRNVIVGGILIIISVILPYILKLFVKKESIYEN